MASLDETVTVTIKNCKIVGTKRPASERYPKPLDIFYGIPYAEARRFKSAESLPLDTSTQTIDAKRPGPSPSYFFAQEPTAESPLRLDIIRPSSSSGSTNKDLLPVAIYIHGGGFNVGNRGERDLASFAAWSEKDMLVVSISYRLGGLGFLAKAMASEDDGGENENGPERSNLGLMDQRIAVEWVRSWVGEFGGDGGNMTVMGTSAGAHAIGHHLIHPTPLPFRKAVLESGSATARAILSPQHPRSLTQRKSFLTGLKKHRGTSIATIPVDTYLTEAFLVWMQNEATVTWPFQPVIDGAGGLVPDLPLNTWGDMLGEGGGERAKGLSVITGFCSHEGSSFVPQKADTNAEFRSFFTKLIPSMSASDLDELEKLYPDPVTDSSSPYALVDDGSPASKGKGRQFRRLYEAYGHYGYICPVLYTAHVLSRAGANVYVYEYAAKSAAFGTASHGDQAIIVTHDLSSIATSAPSSKEGLVATAKAMNQRWTEFVASADGRLPAEQWPAFKTPIGESSDGSSSSSSSSNTIGTGELLVFGDGNDEAAGGTARGEPVKTRRLTEREVRQCMFWWARMELSQGMGVMGGAQRKP